MVCNRKPLDHLLDANELLNLKHKSHVSKPLHLKILKKEVDTAVGFFPMGKYLGIEVEIKKKRTPVSIIAFGRQAIKHLEDNIKIGGLFQFEMYQVNNCSGYPGIEVNTSSVINSFEKLGYYTSYYNKTDYSSKSVKVQILGFDNVDIYNICQHSRIR